MFGQIAKLFQDRYIQLILLAFVISRVIAYLFGVKSGFEMFFGVGPANGMDLVLLKTKLWESVFYQHGQPPLFLLFSGVIIKLFPHYFTYVFKGIFYLISIAQFLLLFKVLSSLHINLKVALALTLYFVLSPVTILHENWHNYTQFEGFFIILIIWFLVKALNSNRLSTYFYFFLTLAFFILLRNMFHLVWFISILTGLLILRKREFRKIITAAVFPFILASSWYIKNYFLFGVFASSTWLGIGMATITQPTETVAKVGLWKPASSYYQYITPSNKYPDVEILHKEMKDNGDPSYFHIDYLAISKEFLRVGLIAIKENPLQYLKNVLKASGTYFSPVSTNYQLDVNHEKIIYYSIFYDFRLLNFCYYNITGRYLYEIQLFIIPIYILVFFLSLYVATRHFKADRNTKIIILFLLFNILYITLVSVMVELKETNRYRYPTIPCMLILIGLLITHYESKIRKIYSIIRS